MDFNGFRPEGLDLLIENRLHNSKDFYEAHKPQFKELVSSPLYALIERMIPTMQQIDPLFVVEPRRMVSRIRRDTRFTNDKSLYRDHVWITFGRTRQERFSERPVYYFEITPEYYGYGCGYYQAPPNEMQIARDMIFREDKSFLEAFRAVNGQKHFLLYGEKYKRLKYQDAPQKYQPWLNRKNLGLCYELYDFTALFNGDFVNGMLQDVKSIAPFYRFLCSIKEHASILQTEAAQ